MPSDSGLTSPTPSVGSNDNNGRKEDENCNEPSGLTRSVSFMDFMDFY